MKRPSGMTLLQLLTALMLASALACGTNPPAEPSKIEPNPLLKDLIESQLLKANVNAAKVEIKILENAARLYLLHTGVWPASLEDLKTNNSRIAHWEGPYIEKEDFNDPWGNPYEILNNKNDSEDFLLRSQGPPGKNAEITNVKNDSSSSSAGGSR